MEHQDDQSSSRDRAASEHATVRSDLENTLSTALDRVDALSAEMVELQRRAALGAVAGLLAHEVNNILTPVLARVRVARKPDASPDAVEAALRAADECVSKTAEIARAILALGRGGTADQPQTADILDTARLALAALGRDLGRDGITCELRIAPDTRAAIAASSLQQVFVNLFQNARNAMVRGPASGRRLTVECRRLEGPIGTLLLDVVDTGPGIPVERQATIFEPFDRPRTDSAGTGLGLTVCRELLVAAGGSIRIGDRSGGAHLVIRLPAAADAGADSAEAATPASSPGRRAG
ncbi:MAG: HAMP domain-containing sensor histidine kinase [Planctomycetota bacterium]